MNDQYFCISGDEKSRIVGVIKTSLSNHPDIVFAYLHGSFVTEEKFRDIDLAFYLQELPPLPLQVELQLETEFGNEVRKYPVDVRILNRAPLSFQYNVIKEGLPVIVRDDDARCNFVERTFRDYFDFAPFSKRYLKEALEGGI